MQKRSGKTLGLNSDSSRMRKHRPEGSMAYHALRSVYDLSPIYGFVQFYTAHMTFIVKLYEKLQKRATQTLYDLL